MVIVVWNQLEGVALALSLSLSLSRFLSYLYRSLACLARYHDAIVAIPIHSRYCLRADPALPRLTSDYISPLSNPPRQNVLSSIQNQY